MAGELLLDTGALIGLLDRSQSIHEACVEFFAGWEGAVVTSEAVLTEASHLLAPSAGGPAACVDFVLRGGVVMPPSTEISLARCRALLEKYAALPMDFADATLVVLAEELGADLVFTFDRDFAVYRIHGRKHFKIVPGRT